MDLYSSTNLNYSSLTSDDNDNDNVTSSTTIMPPAVVKRIKKNKFPKKDNYSDNDDELSDIDGVSSNFNRKRLKKSHSITAATIDNALLYEVTTSTHNDTMIQFACKHCCNRHNLQVMEWSEAVLIQLCDLKTEHNYKHNSWSITKDIVDNNQWSLPVSYNVRKYASAFKSLSQILEQNHQFKLKEYNLNPAKVFINIPNIRYNILETYKIDSQKISVPNRFPDLKLKIK